MAVAYATRLTGPAGIAGHLSQDTQGACLPRHVGPAASDTSSRIEPIAVGERQWREIVSLRCGTECVK